MSDTSVVAFDSDNEMGQRGNFWTRLGANICVCILIALTIVLTIVLILVLRRLYQFEKEEAQRAVSAGKTFQGWLFRGPSSDKKAKTVANPSKVSKQVKGTANAAINAAINAAANNVAPAAADEADEDVADDSKDHTEDDDSDR